VRPDDGLGVVPDLRRVVLDPPGLGKSWRCSRWSIETMVAAASKTMQRVDVVPWSMAAMYREFTPSVWPMAFLFRFVVPLCRPIMSSC
jgi:hypothetical protein